MEALRELTSSTIAVADLLEPFFARLKVDGRSFDYYLSIAINDPALRNDIAAIKTAIRRRQRAIEAVQAEAEARNQKVGA